MSIIVEFEFRPPEMVLEETFERVPEVELEVSREVAMDPVTPIAFLWVSGCDLDAFERAAEEDETVAGLQRYGRRGDEVLYRLVVSEDTGVNVYPAWVERGGELLYKEWGDGLWYAEMRFPDYESLQSLREWCSDNGVEFRLQSVYQDEGIDDRQVLTDDQREVLELALESGFFEVPRQASMRDLADELDVSTQAVSERLRRANRRLVAEFVGE